MSVKPVDLPDECWELIFRSFGHRRHYESVSSVCKQFLSITNRLQSSLTIFDPTILVLPQLFVRFRNIKFIDLSHFHGDIDGVLCQIARSGLALDSLDISDQKILPVQGLREFSSRMRNLRVLSCSSIRSLRDSDLLVIADCFPFLEELDISFPENGPKYSSASLKDARRFAVPVSDFGIMALTMVLKNLRKVNLSGNRFITDESLLFLSKNCEYLKEIAICDCDFITQVGISSAIHQRPNLTSISLSNFGNGRINGRPNINPDFIDSLMSLKSLTTIDFSNSSVSDDLLCSVAEEGLPLKRVILRECCNCTYAGISYLLSKCQSVEYLDLQKANFLTDQHMRELSLFIRNVTFINLSGFMQLTNSTFLILTRNCPFLKEIKMVRTNLGVEGLENCLVDFVHTEVKTLHLGKNLKLRDEDVKKIASICPNLELLDLSSCWGISEKGVVEALKKCCKIKYLSLAYCAGLMLFEINFDLPKLEVLNLSESRIGDEALSIISKTCCGLTHLDLQNCFNVTANGVKQVVENCRGLREINLKCCNKVSGDIIPWMVSSMPSLRKIMAPPGFVFSEGKTRLFLRHGCLVC